MEGVLPWGGNDEEGLDRSGRVATRSGLWGDDARGGRRGGPATVSGLGDGSGQGVAATWRRRAVVRGVGVEERVRKKNGEEEEKSCLYRLPFSPGWWLQPGLKAPL